MHGIHQFTIRYSTGRGTMNKKGFTLIELLIVVVIIGILAAIAIPRFSETRERAYVSTMTSDLRNIQTLQEQYHFDNSYVYAGSADALNFVPSDGVAVDTWTAGADNFTITMSHSGTDRTCTLLVDTDPATDDGITCTDP